ncbi:MAG: hypothetical protein HGA85_06150 [Nanoarchaeota archaeon]|nr:hypothetical protein [Nanoarchaeota archaeon]
MQGANDSAKIGKAKEKLLRLIEENSNISGLDMPSLFYLNYIKEIFPLRHSVEENLLLLRQSGTSDKGFIDKINIIEKEMTSLVSLLSSFSGELRQTLGNSYGLEAINRDDFSRSIGNLCELLRVFGKTSDSEFKKYLGYLEGHLATLKELMKPLPLSFKFDPVHVDKAKPSVIYLHDLRCLKIMRDLCYLMIDKSLYPNKEYLVLTEITDCFTLNAKEWIQVVSSQSDVFSDVIDRVQKASKGKEALKYGYYAPIEPLSLYEAYLAPNAKQHISPKLKEFIKIKAVW